MIEVEQSAQPFGFTNRPVLSLCTCDGEGDDIGEPLMIAFVLMVGQIFLERVVEIEDASDADHDGIPDLSDEVTPLPSLAESLDATNLNWSTGGSAGWQPQLAVTHDGVEAAQSGAITHSQESWVQTTVVGPGKLTYWWKVAGSSG